MTRKWEGGSKFCFNQQRAHCKKENIRLPTTEPMEGREILSEKNKNKSQESGYQKNAGNKEYSAQ
jgi:hypothetical protein